MEYEGCMETDEQGRLYIYNRAQFDAFFKENPGRRFIFKAERVPLTNSGRMTAYFFAEVLPKLITGFKDLGENHNKASMMEEIKKYCPTMHKSCMNGEDINHYDCGFNDLGFEDKKAVIDECIQLGSQIGVVIDEPK